MTLFAKSHICVYLMFCAVLLGAVLFLRPGWGLMDDPQNLGMAANFSKAENKISAFGDLLKSDISSNGRFRPLNILWIVGGYEIFSNHPELFYFWSILFGLALLPLWGRLIGLTWKDVPVSSCTVWVYPLVFFCFTPFNNIFIYLSVQERMLSFFSLGAVYFFYQAYAAGRSRDVWLSFGSALLCVLSKETGIAVMGALLIVSGVCWVLAEQRKIASQFLVLAGFFSAGYYLFIKSIIGGYSSKYQGFSISVIAKNIIDGPTAIKLLFLAGLVGAFFVFMRTLKKRTTEDAVPLIWPVLILLYIVVLSPWDFSNYLLAPLGPFVLAMVFPLYRGVQRGSRARETFACFGLCIFSFVFLMGILIPRLSEIASVRPLEAFLKVQNQGTVYFFPAGSFESPLRLHELTGCDIRYIGGEYLRSVDLVNGKEAFIIVDRNSKRVILEGLRAGDIAYANQYWRVRRIVRSIGETGIEEPSFSGTWLQEFIKRAKVF